ncbi:dTMP kinase [Aliarcobacter cryaerophilus]|uniref:dTMP kinase n=1 Tax=Aliarcobacter cryaerophilus TaxID=28198 RepID=UPI0021B3678B|nr:dTMP kinase [Aliarcobacter cryaerophilus]MCT7513706.1 dTMP kinase [Aliarcobacter cryaerophilus]
MILKSGFYLVLEGVDFTGKSTLATELVKRLQEIYGKDTVIHKREPSNINYGKKMRDVLNQKVMTEDDEVKAAQFMLLDRVENTSAVSQLLRENKIIVQERNFLTALVYNEAKDTKEVQFIQEANRLSLKPDCLALLTISDDILSFRLNGAKEQRGSLDSYETFEKVIKRKRDYMNFGDYIDILLRNDNQDCFEDSINALIKIVNENFKGKR